MWNEVKPSVSGKSSEGAGTLARVGSAGKPIKDGARIGEKEKVEPNDKRRNLIISAVALPVLALAITARSGEIFGFGAGLMIALILRGAPVYALIEYCALTVLLGGGVAEKAAGLFGVGVAAALALVLRKKKCVFPVTLVSSFVAMAGSAFIPDGSVPSGLVSSFVAVATAYAAHVGLRPLLSLEKGTKTELGCQAIILFVLALGAAGLKAGDFDFSYALGFLAIAVTGRIYGAKESVIAAVCVGLGKAANDFSANGIAFFVLTGAAYAFFSVAPRLIGAAASVLAAAGFKLYFNVDYTDTLWVLASMAAGGAAFCVVPRKWFQLASERVAEPKRGYDGLLVESELARTSEYLASLAAVFDEMSGAFVSPDKTENAFGSVYSAVEDVCRNCGRCKAAGFDCKAATDKLCEVSIRKGRAEISDVPFFCQAECPHAAKLIKRASDAVYELETERKRKLAIEKERNAVAAFAGQASEILLKAARNARFPIGSLSEETLAEEELLGRGVNVRGIMTAGERVNVLVAAGDDETTVADVMGKVCGGAYETKSRERCGGGLKTISLTPRPAFDAVVGTSALAAVKGGIGDGYSLTKLDGNKLMVALCDGMGRGREAEKTGERAINLIESCYRAGFDHEFVIGTVNKFLAFGKEENFAAFDALVLDLDDLSYTLVKLASPATLVKSEGNVFSIEGSSLPLGAPCPIVPTVYRGSGKDGDEIVLCTDGVTDALGERETCEILKNSETLSPRALSDFIVKAAAKRVSGDKRDDMTVVSVRLMRRV